jgi:hypothetical protein
MLAGAAAAQMSMIRMCLAVSGHTSGLKLKLHSCCLRSQSSVTAHD